MPPFDLERRRRRNRRLTILALVVVLLGGAGATAYFVQRNQSDASARQRVLESVAAFEQDNYEQVVELLEDTSTPTNTLRVMQGDADAMWRYVLARKELSMPNAEHVARLFPALRRVVSLDPGNYEAGQMLLELLMAVNRNTEALDTAGRLIKAHPRDADLLRIRSGINMSLDNNDEALDDALAATQLEPLDVRTQMDVATLMRELNRDPEDFYKRAGQLLADNPGDPRAEVILARANLLMGLAPQAEDLLESASDRDPPDIDFVRILVGSLDLLKMFGDSYAYLSRVVGEGLDGPLEYELYFRDFEHEEYQKVVDRLGSIALPEAHPNLVALGAMSRFRMGETQQANALLGELASREDDELSQYWVNCLRSRWATTVDLGEYVRLCDTACKDYPRHAYLHFLLADGYLRVGEQEAAVAALRVALEWRPSWATPYNISAELLLDLGRPEEAADAAYAALRRWPIDRHAITNAVAQARATNTNDSLATERAMEYIDEDVLGQLPGEPRSYAASIELLARAGDKEAAIARINTAMQRDTPLPQDLLLYLAGVSRDNRLSMEQPILAHAQASYGVSPRVALDQALLLAERSSTEDAVAQLRGMMPESPSLAWRVAEAQLLQRLNDQGAAQLWIRLADDHPDNLQVQSLSLQAVGVVQDRAFADRVINRMRSLAGPDSVGWKVERARYLLGSEDRRAASVEAMQLLQDVIKTAPNRVEPYRLLSHCQQLQGDPVAAARSIEQAANLSPNNPLIQFQFGQILHNQRDFIAARQPLLRVARDEKASPNLRLNALMFLADEGEVDTLIPILEGLQRQYAAPDQQFILLANLYITTGRAADADRLCELMLRNPTPNAIAFAADYYWQTGRRDRAQAVVDRVNELDMPADIRHTLLGQHAARTGEQDAALNHYRAAALAAPENAGRWRNLVILGLVFGRPTDAVRDARSALQHVSDDPSMRAVSDHADLLEAVAGDVRFRPVAATIVADATNRDVGVEALQFIIDGSTRRRSTGAVARDLATLANEYPTYLALQNLSAAMLSDVGRYQHAADIATRTMDLFPADGVSARLATVALADRGEWRRTTNAAQEWGRRTPGQRPLADVYLSAAQRNLDRAHDAEQTLLPHIPRAMASPENYRSLLGEYATVLVQLGRINEAWQVLEPNLGRGPAWRDLAMRLVGSVLPNTRTAEAWLDAIEPTIPTDDPAELLAFAQSCFYAGDRLNEPSLLERARATINVATQQGETPAAAWFLRGRIADSSGDLQAAEESYREVLKIEPDAAMAQNNLAMVLVTRGRDIGEAVALSRAATASNPESNNFKDTLARVLSRNGQHDEALDVIERAIQNDRQNLEWLRTKAQILDTAGRNDEAERLRMRYRL